MQRNDSNNDKEPILIESVIAALSQGEELLQELDDQAYTDKLPVDSFKYQYNNALISYRTNPKLAFVNAAESLNGLGNMMQVYAWVEAETARARSPSTETGRPRALVPAAQRVAAARIGRSGGDAGKPVGALRRAEHGFGFDGKNGGGHRRRGGRNPRSRSRCSSPRGSRTASRSRKTRRDPLPARVFSRSRIVAE